MLAFLNQVRKPTLDLPLDVRRKMWFKPFMQSYLVVFIGYLTMYLIRKNFNIAQNDMISTYGLSMTQLGMIGLGFSITYGVGKTLVSYYADGKNTKQFLPFMLILSAICMLGFSASMGAGSTSLFLMIAFYALSGFFQSTGGSCSYSTITKWTPRRKRGTFLGFWNISHNLGGAGAAGVALFGANYLFDGHVIGMFIFPSIIALIVGFIGLRYGSDSPESYGLGTAEELFGEAISEEDKRDRRKCDDQVADLCRVRAEKQSDLAAVLLQHLPLRGAYRYRSVVHRVRLPGAEAVERGGDSGLYPV